MRLRSCLELLPVVAGVILTMANSVAPTSRGVDVQDIRTLGDLRPDLDHRFYEDKGLEIGLPRGKYSSLRLVRSSIDATKPREDVVLDIRAGDPRLDVGIARIQILPPMRDDEAWLATYTLTIETLDRGKCVTRFRLGGRQGEH